jgi:hypothetical protein
MGKYKEASANSVSVVQKIRSIHRGGPSALTLRPDKSPYDKNHVYSNGSRRFSCLPG